MWSTSNSPALPNKRRAKTEVGDPHCRDQRLLLRTPLCRKYVQHLSHTGSCFVIFNLITVVEPVMVIAKVSEINHARNSPKNYSSRMSDGIIHIYEPYTFVTYQVCKKYLLTDGINAIETLLTM